MDTNFQSFDMELLSNNLLKAREESGKSIKEASSIIGIPSSRIKNYEKGAYMPSLPELETLSFLYRIPFMALVGKIDIENFIHEPDAEQIQHLINIRQRLISTRIQLAREKKDLTYKKLSEIADIPSSRVKRYESGGTTIPIDELMRLCEALEMDFAELEDSTSPVGKWQAQQALIHNIQQLPEETLLFIEKPENKNFLQAAKSLAETGADKLNQLAHSLLKIVDSTPTHDDNIQE